jgi:hypothetical protein
MSEAGSASCATCAAVAERSSVEVDLIVDSGGSCGPPPVGRRNTFRTNMRANAMEFDEYDAEDEEHEGLTFEQFRALTKEHELGAFTDAE